jgi:hypothetical protein
MRDDFHEPAWRQAFVREVLECARLAAAFHSAREN